ncbi:hypothetical protein STPYR_11380 [uncultured Stenotrophomonas sp.]|uniref:Uncharacterized protein n=1 Tax=uncultured Stenotrophomonas sp. TaxID=165438 RepID=A0A1Y5Q2I9_9GAMM|nr:hypothetical protein STPYR_11380 [uncultured Stenotrophomonas sp.]
MSPIFKNRNFWKRTFQILTWLLILAFISHPELRLLVPLLDSLGLELLLGLAGLQLLDLYQARIAPFIAMLTERVLQPAFVALVDAANHRRLRPAGRFLWNLLLTGSGWPGTALAFKLSTLHVSARPPA